MNRNPHDVSTLLAEHGRRFYGLLYRLTLRTDVADDLLQELFCKLANSDGFQRAENPLAYALRTATNLAFDWRRANKRFPIDPVDAAGLPGPANSPLVDLVRREQFERVLNAIGELPEPGRQFVVLHYLDGQSYDAIAEQFEKTSHQIRALCHKGIVRLRRSLGEEDVAVPDEERGGAKS